MNYATHHRGAITLAMLFGHVAPLLGATAVAPRREYAYPASASRGERRSIRLHYMVDYLRDCAAATCKDVAAEFGIISEVAYKDLCLLKADGKVRQVPRSKPVLWEAAE